MDYWKEIQSRTKTVKISMKTFYNDDFIIYPINIFKFYSKSKIKEVKIRIIIRLRLD